LAKKREDVAVYLFTGFLEGGKTKFIQETLEDKRFCNGEKTLLLVCEEGEEEYAPDQFADSNVFVRIVEDQAELTAENLSKWLADCDGDRVVVEYNGMWLIDTLYSAMPEGWMVYQEMMFADANTFFTYNANMRQLTYDKLKSCEMVIFNRYKPNISKQELHSIVRGASRRADIAFEYVGGKVEYDDIEDPLPFDLDAPIVEIGDDDYAEWYRDMGEEPDKYEDKVVRFKCFGMVPKKLPKGSFVVGRYLMTCCAEDTQLAGLVCQWDNASSVTNEQWMILTARINFKYNRAYGAKGPVLTHIESELCDAPEQPVATFY